MVLKHGCVLAVLVCAAQCTSQLMQSGAPVSEADYAVLQNADYTTLEKEKVGADSALLNALDAIEAKLFPNKVPMQVPISTPPMTTATPTPTNSPPVTTATPTPTNTPPTTTATPTPTNTPPVTTATPTPTIGKIPTNVTISNPMTISGNKFSVSATLRVAAIGTPIMGQIVTITVLGAMNGQTVQESPTTDGNGVATFTSTGPLTPGFNITAVYEAFGSQIYLPSNATLVDAVVT